MRAEIDFYILLPSKIHTLLRLIKQHFQYEHICLRQCVWCNVQRENDEMKASRARARA